MTDKPSQYKLGKYLLEEIMAIACNEVPKQTYTPPSKFTIKQAYTSPSCQITTPDITTPDYSTTSPKGLESIPSQQSAPTQPTPVTNDGHIPEVTMIFGVPYKPQEGLINLAKPSVLISNFEEWLLENPDPSHLRDHTPNYKRVI
ncbi:MAG TPA: hypothetical protein VJK72_05235 [Candidatus Nanoarchaeia archaeon]|nr:hypothetical protein [Candidatus Nanoarchaeia archaeon]